MDQCQEKIIHGEKVELARRHLPDPQTIQGLADIFKALGDPSRMKAVLALAACELCVCDLAAVCELSESAVSHQLRILRSLKIVRCRRQGKVVFYRLDDMHVHSLVLQSLEHVKE